jgi:hypothetical protein
MVAVSDFSEAYFDGINCFYIPEEERPALQPCFEVPVNALDRAVTLIAKWFMLNNRIDRARRRG